MTQISARILVPTDALIGGHRLAHGVHRTGASERRQAQDRSVVLIHGTPSSSVIWRNIVPILTEAGYRVHVYDLLGYGASERPQDPAVDTSVSGQVPVLLGLMELWKLESAHVVAHDIGGAVAQRLAVLHRNRVRSLVLLDCVSFDSWPSERTRQQMREGLDKLIAAPPDRHRAHFRDWLLSTVENKGAMIEGPLDHYLDIITGPIGQASLFQHQIAHYDPRHTDELTDRLHELGELSVRLIWGERDGWQRLEWARRLHTAIPGSELCTVPDAGHFVMEDAPGTVGALVTEFLDAQSLRTM
jgi:pimeloyl-ACP methyl ester carboxylesterase